MTTESLVLLAVLALVLVLTVLLLVRRPRVDLPPEWLARLAALESTAQATQLAVAKNDGAMDALANQLAGFTQATQHTLESLRHAVDERLAQAVAESRNGRAELLAAFGVFEARLEQRQTALDASLAQRFDGLQQAVAGRLDTHTYGALDDRLLLVLGGDVRFLTMDLGQLAYISSAGVRSLFRTRKQLEARHGRLLLANVQPQVQKVFDIVKAVPLSEIFRTVEEADAYLDKIQKKIVAGDDD